jgi:hypothetical protein
LYFTVRGHAGCDIVVSKRNSTGGWSKATAVSALNSTADDVGPVFSADGGALFFSSNRPGGAGGFDIYKSTKTDTGWSAPENLGDSINTAAHDQDPTMAANGQTLFFASNRTPRMADRRDGSQRGGDSQQPWSATLRAEQGLDHFDLYVAQLGGAGSWSVEPLVTLNSARHDGQPFVSPNGVFLYFTSDRANASGEVRNFDIYRARLDGVQPAAIESLGREINSAANEHEPSLSPEGFRLVFSSDRSASAESPEHSGQFLIYSSVAVETYTVTGWDWTRLESAQSFFRVHGWTLVLVALVSALIVAVVWFWRRASWRRARVPGFLVVAIVAHAVVGAGSFFVYFGDDIAKKIEQVFDEVLVVANLHQSHEPGQELYEKVADLQSVETVKPSPIFRQVTEAASVTAPPQSAVPSLPMKVGDPVRRRRTDDTPTPRATPIELDRREKIDVEPPRPQIDIERTRAVIEETPELAQARVELDRNAADPQLKAANIKRRAAMPDLAPEQIAGEPEESVPTPDATTTPAAIARAAASTAVANEAQPEQLELPEPVESNTQGEVARAEVQVARRADSPKLTVRPAAPGPMSNQPSAPQRAAVTPRAAVAPQPTQGVAVALDRTRDTSVESPTDVNAAVAALQPAEPTPGETLPAAAGVTIDRKVVSAPAPESMPLQVPRKIAAPSAIEVVQDSLSVGRAADEILRPQPAPQFQRAAARRPDQTTAIELASTAATGVDVKPLDVAGAAVQVERRADVTVEPTSASLATEIKTESSPRRQTELKVAARDSTAPTQPPADPQLNRLPKRAGASETSGQLRVEALAANAPAEAGEATRPETQVTVARREGLTLALADKTGPARRKRPVPAAVAADVVIAEGSPEIESSPVDSQLARSRAAPASTSETDAAALDEVAAPAPADADQPASDVAAAEIGLPRGEPLTLEISVETPGEWGGRFNRRRPQLVIGALAEERVDAPLSFSSIASRIQRRPARAPLLHYAEDNIGLQAMLRLRGADENTKRDLVQAFGGKDEVMSALATGLTWIEQHQHEDGHWSLHAFGERCQGHKCSGHGNQASDTAATGLALLPFLGDGHTHQTGKHQQMVKRGLEWLISKQKEDGDLFTGGNSNARMYSHGIATIALCEAYGMTRDEHLKAPAQKAIDFIVFAQHGAGGWRYAPKQPGDTSVMGWQIMALKSGQIAGLSVPAATLQKAKQWLHKNEGQGAKTGVFAYQGRNGNAAMTAEACLCLQYFGVASNDAHLRGGAQHLLKNLPKKGAETSYYWYYGTQVMFHMQGDNWTQWNDALRDIVLEDQVRTGPMKGTWDPRDNWEKAGGRIYATSLRLLMLEVYYRHLPLYQVLGE